MELSVDPRDRKYLNVFRHGAFVWLHRTAVLWWSWRSGSDEAAATGSSTPDKHSSPQAFPYPDPTEKEPHSHHLHSPAMCRVEALNNTCHIRSPGAMCLSIGHPEGASRRSETGAGVRSKHGEDRSHEETSIVRSGRHNPPRGPQTVPAEIAGPPPARSASLMPGGCIFKGLPPTFFLHRFGYCVVPFGHSTSPPLQQSIPRKCAAGSGP
jgi:hypothetical protein